MNKRSDTKQKSEAYLRDSQKKQRKDTIMRARFSYIKTTLNKSTKELFHYYPYLSLDQFDKYLLKNIIIWLNEVVSIDRFDFYIFLIKEQDIYKQHRGMIGLRKILASIDDKTGEIVQRVINLEGLPFIIDFCLQKKHKHLQNESLWCLNLLLSSPIEDTLRAEEKGRSGIFLYLASGFLNRRIKVRISFVKKGRIEKGRFSVRQLSLEF